jgi:hypothetical protein
MLYPVAVYTVALVVEAADATATVSEAKTVSDIQ